MFRCFLVQIINFKSVKKVQIIEEKTIELVQIINSKTIKMVKKVLNLLEKRCELFYNTHTI